MEDQFVFELTAEVTTDVEVFYEPLEFLPPEIVLPEAQAESEVPMDAAQWWTEEALLADPEMIAWYAWRDAMEAYLAAPTLEEQLAVVAQFQSYPEA